MSSQSIAKHNGGFLVIIFILTFSTLALLATLLVGVGQFEISQTPEAQTGVLIVLAVSSMAVLLFTVSAGFRALGLSANDEPLGLPPGSVRAFIALMLIMIFAVLSVWSVRLVGEGRYFNMGPFQMSDSEALELASSESIFVERVPNREDLFFVWQVRPISLGGDRLAQQLVTTIATLVVAVAGFYFGAANVQAALQQHSKVSTAPLIRDISPGVGVLDSVVTATLTGRNLSSLKSVRLVKAEKVIEATDVLTFNDSSIQCKFTIPQSPESSGKWDVVVENTNGEADRLVEAFTV